MSVCTAKLVSTCAASLFEQHVLLSHNSKKNALPKKQPQKARTRFRTAYGPCRARFNKAHFKLRTVCIMGKSGVTPIPPKMIGV